MSVFEIFLPQILYINVETIALIFHGFHTLNANIYSNKIEIFDFIKIKKLFTFFFKGNPTLKLIFLVWPKLSEIEFLI